MIIDLEIAGEDVKIELDGTNGSCTGRFSAQMYWSPSWVPGTRLVSKSFSSLATISITNGIVPVISIGSFDFRQNEPVKTIQSFDVGPAFPRLATIEAKFVQVRDESPVVQLPHIELDVDAFPKLQQLILGPIEIADVATWQIAVTKSKTID